MNFKRILLAGSLIFSLFVPLFSQENQQTDAMNTETEFSVSPDEQIESKKRGLPNFFDASRFILGLTPGFYINPDSNQLKSAPDRKSVV